MMRNGLQAIGVELWWVYSMMMMVNCPIFDRQNDDFLLVLNKVSHSDDTVGIDGLIIELGYLIYIVVYNQKQSSWLRDIIRDSYNRNRKFLITTNIIIRVN